LSRVEVVLNNKTINDPNVNDYSYTIDERYTFIDEECCRSACQLYVEASMSGKIKARTNPPISIQRDENKCIIPSSSSVAPSSSSSLPVSTLSLQPLTFSGSPTLKLKTGAGNKGFDLSSGTPTESKDDASFYFAGNCMLGTNGETKLVSMFDRSQYGPTYTGNARNGEITEVLVSNPTSASQFIFIPSDWESSSDYMEYIYYVACPSAKSEWDSSCYLIYAYGECMSRDPEIEIKIWKAQ
jgi:hypothetical protein